MRLNNIHWYLLILLILIISSVFLIIGPSENLGRIEGTRWANEATEYHGIPVPAQIYWVEFGKDGKLIWHDPEKKMEGKYKLGRGYKVYFEFGDLPWRSNARITEIVIVGDSMSLTDDLGNLPFARVQ